MAQGSAGNVFFEINKVISNLTSKYYESRNDSLKLISYAPCSNCQKNEKDDFLIEYRKSLRSYLEGNPSITCPKCKVKTLIHSLFPEIAFENIPLLQRVENIEKIENDQKHYKGVYNGKDVCMTNILDYDNCSAVNSFDSLRIFEQELVMIKDIQSDNIVKFFGCIFHFSTLTLISEYHSLTLFNAIQHNLFTENDVKYNLTNDICKGLKFLHSFNPPIIHG